MTTSSRPIASPYRVAIGHVELRTRVANRAGGSRTTSWPSMPPAPTTTSLIAAEDVS